MPETKTQNVQRPTSNAQRSSGGRAVAFDLDGRRLNYATAIIRLTEGLPQSRAGNHVAGQLLRSGTSPLPNHGEAQAAESRDDFVHKLGICLKELSESRRWLRLILRVPLTQDERAVQALAVEKDELILIFAKSIKTAKAGGVES
jgi:four helix bundle protein